MRTRSQSAEGAVNADRGRKESGERRWDPRVSDSAVGVISYSGQRFSSNCRVLDVSAGGARIELDLDDWVNSVSSSHSLPSAFKVVVPTLGFEADCVVMWRSKAQLGIRFSGRVRALPRQFRKLRGFGG